MYKKRNDFSIKNCQFRDFHGNQKSITEPEFTRLGYDPCDILLENYESISPGLYKLKDRTMEDSCHMDHSGYNNRQSGILAKSVDIESEIKGLNYLNSKCPSKRYNPLQNCKTCQKCNLGLPCGCAHCNEGAHYKRPQCDEQLVPFQAKTFKPCGNIAAQYQDRFQNLCVDVQDPSRIHSNAYIGANTRINSRDATFKDNKHLRKVALLADNSKKYSNLDFCGPVRTPFLQSSLGCTYFDEIEKYKVLPYF
jgi:hypothetical protein